jgi:hypothetical protein
MKKPAERRDASLPDSSLFTYIKCTLVLGKMQVMNNSQYHISAPGFLAVAK